MTKKLTIVLTLTVALVLAISGGAGADGLAGER